MDQETCNAAKSNTGLKLLQIVSQLPSFRIVSLSFTALFNLSCYIRRQLELG